MIREPRSKYRVQITVKECCSITVKYQETQVRVHVQKIGTSRKSHNFDVRNSIVDQGFNREQRTKQPVILVANYTTGNSEEKVSYSSL